MAKNNEARYKVAKLMIEANQINIFSEIFSHIPKSVIAKELHTNSNSFTRIINHPLQIRFKDVIKIAELLDVKFSQVAGLIFEQQKRLTTTSHFQKEEK